MNMINIIKNKIELIFLRLVIFAFLIIIGYIGINTFFGG